MLRSLGRTALVCLGLFGLLVGAQLALSRDERPAVRAELNATGRTAEGKEVRWRFAVREGGRMFLDGRRSSLDELLSKVQAASGPLAILGESPDDAEPSWRFEVDGAGGMALDGKPFTLAQLQAKLERYARSDTVVATKPVTVADVVAAVKRGELPPPVIEKVSLPGLSYGEAHPGATDEPEVVIREYHGHPMYDSQSLVPDKLKEFYPEKFPPVAQRLPINPAVLRGPDGIGRYSTRDNPMIWRRCAIDDQWNLYRKVGYPALLRFDPAGRLQPNIAWKYEVSEDYRVFTFYLRKGMKWSDGRPYTTDDILFVTNTIIGSPAWTAAPDWMQETDGANMVYAEDVHDWAGLAAAIREQAASSRASPGKQLWKVIDEEPTGKLQALKQMLGDLVPGRQPDEDTQYRIAGKLNSALTSRGFYDPEAWREVDFKTELEELRKRGYSRLSKEEIERYELLMLREDWLGRAADIADEEAWKAGDVTQLNVLLFREAYGRFVAPATRQRCKVEAVPDEHGDASHILRFTFRKPNSIFIETTATFMFYLGIFNTQKHFRSRYHPYGRSELDIFDILKWRELLGGMKKAADSAASSPGKHIWSLMSEDMKRRLAGRLPTEDRGTDEEYKQEIVDEFNRILARRDFYDRASWATVDVDSEQARLMKDGYSPLQERERRRVGELLKRQDFLRRGVDDLSAEELFELNLFMLRAAYDGDPRLEDSDRDDQKLVALNREDALDKQAQWRGFRTWGALWNERGRYHKGWNEHVPTICPWRIVSDPDDTTVKAVRNPYYFKVDIEGNQLPYVDMIECEKVDRKPIRLLKLQSGNIHFHERETEWDEYTPLKQEEKAGGYEVRLWANDYCGELVFISCQQHHDPEYRELQADPKFRQALSMALNRQEMIDIVWQGMGSPAQFSVPEGSKYYNSKMHRAYIDYDPEGANKILDEMKLDRRAADGTRLLWSGRPLIIDVNTEEERPLAAVQLACNYWRAIGINALMKVRSGTIKWRLYSMGKYDIWVHKEGGNYFGPLIAGSLAPTHPAESVHYSRWAAWVRSGGREGEEPPDRIKELDRMWSKVVTAPNEDAKIKAFRALTDVAAEQLPVIAVTTSPGKVVYVRNDFKNVPKLSLAGWIAHDPGNCNPEIFYIEQGE